MALTSVDQDPGSSTSSASVIRRYQAYFTPAEIEGLSAKQRGKLSVAREERGRQQACGFIDAVGVRCGFPRRTIATAQSLYMRFHLFFPYRDFNYMEVCLSALYVSSKVHDTLKKPRDIVLASYAIRFPHLIKKGTVDPAAVDGSMLESERARVLGIERLLLETVCFRFGSTVELPLVVQLAKTLEMSKDQTMMAWQNAVDSYRTLAPLSYAPQALALGAIYACALLSLESNRLPSSDDVGSTRWSDLAHRLGRSEQWDEQYTVSVAEIDSVAQAILDLHITILSTPLSDPQHALTPSPSSPREVPPAPVAQSRHQGNIANTAFRPSTYWTVQTLTELKVALRELRPVNQQLGLSSSQSSAEYGSHGTPTSAPSRRSEGDMESERGPSGLGQNEGTTRFIWDEGVVA